MLKAVTLSLTALLLAPALAAAAPPAKAVHAQAAEAVAVEAAAQKRYQQWSDEKEGVAADIRDMKAMDSWLEFQNRKYAKYIKKQEEVIAELERRKEEARRIKMELEPFLETVVDSLEQFVSSDLPFLPEERAARIGFLRDSLDDYRLELSEKLRRVFEALLVEMEYGRNVSTTSRELDLNGAPTQVSIFRLGRTALFYQTADGAEAGYWDRASGSWKPLDENYSRTLHRAKDMADRKRAVELLDLPIGAAR
ncbi:DUF3450 domain-containing protein [Salidesulfovibrio onnuriiensis]|uniref:DUF3450 domain-containing protein n=1 Tax=Salidesulfovibrio onnuriiensis TaxID=2583823 RepID=UPI0011C9FC0C|nr:DUF3450 domain-containing protein [Salidesulfovibrio onnuriiensis]